MKRLLLLRGAPAGMAALVFMIVGASPTLSAQTTLDGRVVVRPVTRGDISAYSLASTTQISAGLTTIGLGEPAYLEALANINVPASQIAHVTWTLSGKPAGSKVDLVDSPLGANVPPYEPSDRLVSQVVGQKLLIPDVTGLYTVKVNITSVSAGSADLVLAITGATYVGVAACTLCHSISTSSNEWSVVQSWSKTAHATIFTQGVNGTNSDHYSASCIGCHTVGYDTNAAAINGGFDDIAKQLNWTFPTTMATTNWAAVPDALKNVSNIQCENCHGPGSEHIKGANSILISINPTSGTCAQCHDAPTHHIKNGEWNNSLHAVTTRDPSGAGRDACVGCHTGTGFMGRINGATTISTDYSPINCQTCHQSHGQTTPDGNAHLVRTLAPVKLADGTVVADAGQGALCMNCHQSRQNALVYAAKTAGSSHFGPHDGPQADMLEGTNGFTYDKVIPSSAHSMVVTDTCIGCHMQTVAETDPALTHAGGHTFKPSWTDATKAKHDLVGACQTCHGSRIKSFDFPLMDYDDDGNIDGVQTEVQHMLDKLSAMLPPVGQPKTSLTIDSTWTQPQLKAAYNWLFITNDGSLGIHNTAYTVGLLDASITDLQNQSKK